MTDTAHVRIRRPGGSEVVFCDQLDAQRWLIATATDRTVADHRADPVTINNHCIHCAWCGSVVVVPSTCLLHGEGACPLFSSVMTVKARRAVMELRKAHGRDLPPCCFDMLERASFDLNTTGDFTWRRLFQLVWAQQPDWAW